MNNFKRVPVDEYKVLAFELLELVDAWKRASWWRKCSIAHALACKVWSCSDGIQSALLYHKMGMAALNNRDARS